MTDKMINSARIKKSMSFMWKKKYYADKFLETQNSSYILNTIFFSQINKNILSLLNKLGVKRRQAGGNDR